MAGDETGTLGVDVSTDALEYTGTRVLDGIKAACVAARSVGLLDFGVSLDPLDFAALIEDLKGRHVWGEAAQSYVEATGYVRVITCNGLTLVTRVDQPDGTPVGAMSRTAARFGWGSFSVGLSPKDFAELRGLLTADEREEQAKRWGGNEMRFQQSGGGVTRVFMLERQP